MESMRSCGGEQPFVDRVAIGKQLVEVHRAHDRADIGHGEVEKRLVEVGNLVGGLRGVEDLIESHGVGLDAGIVLGDDLLRRYVQHLLHHVQLGADRVDEGDDQVEARMQRAGIFLEAFDGVVISLRHRLDPGEQRQDDKNHHSNDGIVHAGKRIHLRAPSWSKCVRFLP